jgi:hypothetical protein
MSALTPALAALSALLLSSTAIAGENTEFEMSLRARKLSVPDSILDIWFYNETDDGWIAGNEPRPSIGGVSPGFEFVVKQPGGSGANGIFYFDYIISTMDQGYWDDVEEPPNHLDGDYLVPSDNLALWNLGANFAQELAIVRASDNEGKFGLSFLVGGGLGVAGMVGQVDRWGPEGGVPATIRYAANPGNPDDVKRIPRIYPMIDLNGSLRFNFGNRVVLRVEGGLHSMIYYGATLGIMF